MKRIGPHEGPQEAFAATEADIAVYGGAAGGGKTLALLLEPSRHINVPRFGAVIFRRTRPQIENEGGMWDESFLLYPHLGGVAGWQRLMWKFPSGATVRFNHMQHLKDTYKQKGAQIALIGFDQLEEFEERQFWYMVSRNRTTCGVRPYIRATANPVPDDDETGGWLAELLSWWWDPETGYPIEERAGVVRWFVRIDNELIWGDSKAELEERYPDIPPKSFTFIPARLQDNPTLMEEDPAYMANLMALSLVERERLLGGNWLIRASAGNVFRAEWFRAINGRVGTAARVRYWDKAGSDERDSAGAAWTSGVLMARTPEGRYVIEDIVRGQWRAHDREKVIKQTAEIDGYDVSVYVEQEPGSGGKESAEATIAMLAGWDVHADRVTGSKVERAQPLSAQVEGGNVDIVKADWTRGFLKRMEAFPEGKYKDDVDAATGAFNMLSGMDPWDDEEFDFEEEGGFVL